VARRLELARIGGVDGDDSLAGDDEAAGELGLGFRQARGLV
jgi:hypothetical protein